VTNKIQFISSPYESLIFKVKWYPILHDYHSNQVISQGCNQGFKQPIDLPQTALKTCFVVRYKIKFQSICAPLPNRSAGCGPVLSRMYGQDRKKSIPNNIV